MAYNNIDDILDGVKVNLKYEATGDFDDPLTNMISGVLAQFELYTNVSFTSIRPFDTVQRLEGWADSLTIRYVPIVSVEDFYMVGASDEPFVLGTDYFFVEATGIIYIPLGLDVGLYYVSGTYGYGTTDGAISFPDDVGFAAVMQTTFSWKKRDNLEKKAMSTAGGLITYDEQWGLLKGVKEILDKYVVQ